MYQQLWVLFLVVIIIIDFGMHMAWIIRLQEVRDQGIDGMPSRGWSVLERKWAVVYHPTFTLYCLKAMDILRLDCLS